MYVYKVYIKYACECGHMHAVVPTWRSETKFQVSIHSFHHVGSGCQTQVGRLGR